MVSRDPVATGNACQRRAPTAGRTRSDARRAAHRACRCIVRPAGSRASPRNMPKPASCHASCSFVGLGRSTAAPDVVRVDGTGPGGPGTARPSASWLSCGPRGPRVPDRTSRTRAPTARRANGGGHRVEGAWTGRPGSPIVRLPARRPADRRMQRPASPFLPVSRIREMGRPAT